MNDTELKKQYSRELWGKLLLEMGMEPYDTESSARRVAEYTSQRIASLESEKEQLMDECERLQKENEVLTTKLARIQKLIEDPDPYWAIEEIERETETI